MYYRRLKDLREDHDLTQTQLVELLGMHKTTYTNYEQEMYALSDFLIMVFVMVSEAVT